MRAFDLSQLNLERIHTKKQTFPQWLATARRGDRFVYYRGFLLPEVANDQFLLPAYQAWQGYETGRCTLVQERHGPHDYSYIAVRL